MVRNGSEFFTKGYGYANLRIKAVPNPNTTIWGVASISKTFTATAMMQLYEQGLLDFGKPAQYYLTQHVANGFQLEPTPYLDPITVGNLLTHTSGIDERWIMDGTVPADEPSLQDLKDFLTQTWPGYVKPPNVTTTYSNEAFILNGYLVQLISGASFSTYITNKITTPLGMSSSSTFEQPTPDMEPNLAMGYNWDEASQAYTEVPNWYELNPQPAPEGSFKTTAADMQKYMLMHLNGGVYNNTRIMNQTTAQLMHSLHFTMDPALPGYCYCFYQYWRNGIRAIMHEGDIEGFASLLFLMPEQNIGIFMSMNRVLTPGGLPFMDDPTTEALRQNFIEQFLDRYYPPVQPQPPVSWTSASLDRSNKFAGTYVTTRYPHTTFVKVLRIFSEIEVTAWQDSPNGGIAINDFRYVEVSPLLFRQYNDTNWLYPQIAFKLTDTGDILAMVFDTDCYEPIPWYEGSRFVYSLVFIFGILLVMYPVFCLTLFLYYKCRRVNVKNVQEYYRRMAEANDFTYVASPHRFARPCAIAARVLAVVNCVIFLIFGIFFGIFLAGGSWEMSVPPYAIFLLVLPIITTTISGIMLILFVALVVEVLDTDYSLQCSN